MEEGTLLVTGPRPSIDFSRAIYPAAEAARFAGLHPARVRRWLKGYSYGYGEGVKHRQPVLGREDANRTSYASFLELWPGMQ